MVQILFCCINASNIVYYTTSFKILNDVAKFKKEKSVNKERRRSNNATKKDHLVAYMVCLT